MLILKTLPLIMAALIMTTIAGAAAVVEQPEPSLWDQVVGFFTNIFETQDLSKDLSDGYVSFYLMPKQGNGTAEDPIRPKYQDELFQIAEDNGGYVHFTRRHDDPDTPNSKDGYLIEALTTNVSEVLTQMGKYGDVVVLGNLTETKESIKASSNEKISKIASRYSDEELEGLLKLRSKPLNEKTGTDITTWDDSDSTAWESLSENPLTKVHIFGTDNSDFYVTDNQGIGHSATGGSYYNSIDLWHQTTDASEDQNVYVVHIAGDISDVGNGLAARVVVGNTDTYFFFSANDRSGDGLRLYEIVDGTYTELDSSGGYVDRPKEMRLVVTTNGANTDIDARSWALGGSEPTGGTGGIIFSGSVDSSLQGATGYGGISITTERDGGDIVWDNLSFTNNDPVEDTAYGNLLAYVQGNLTGDQNSTFNFNGNATCLNGDCGDVNATAMLVNYSTHGFTNLTYRDIDVLADVYVDSDDPTLNRGVFSTVNLGNASGSIELAYYTFNLSRVPSNVDIGSAVLNISVIVNFLDDAGEVVNVTVRQIFSNTTFNETNITWTNRINGSDKINETVLDYITFFGGAGEQSGRQIFNVTKAVQLAVDEGYYNVSFVLTPDQGNSTDATDDILFESKEVSNRPNMMIQYDTRETQTIITETVPDYPVYIIPSPSNPNDLSLDAGESSNFSWVLNLTGIIGNHYGLILNLSNSTDSNINFSTVFNVSITQPVAELAPADWVIDCSTNPYSFPHLRYDANGTNVIMSGGGVTELNVTNYTLIRSEGGCTARLVALS